MALVHATLAEQAHAELRRRILAFELPPGHRLAVDRLADELGVSLSPVKEALKQLESDGLVEILPRRGTVVRAFDAADVVNLYDAREVIEAAAARRAIENGGLSPETFAALEEALEDVAAARGEGGHFARQQEGLLADSRFHRLIVEATGNPRLAQIHATLMDQLHLVRRFSMRLPRAAETLAEHRAIIDALREGKPAAAEKAMHAHLRRARQAILAEMAADEERRAGSAGGPAG